MYTPDLILGDFERCYDFVQLHGVSKNVSTDLDATTLLQVKKLKKTSYEKMEMLTYEP